MSRFSAPMPAVAGQAPVATAPAPPQAAQPQQPAAQPQHQQRQQPPQPVANFDPITGAPLQQRTPLFDQFTGQPLSAQQPAPVVAHAPAQVAAFGGGQPTMAGTQPDAQRGWQQPAQPQPVAPPANVMGRQQNGGFQLAPVAGVAPVGTPAQADVRNVQPFDPLYVDPAYAAQFPGVDYASAQRAMGGGAGMPQPGVVTDGQMQYALQRVDPAQVPQDPAQFRDFFTQMFGNTPDAARCADAMAQMIEAKFRSLGLDRVDRRFLAFPEAAGEQGQRGDLAHQIFARSGVAPTPLAQAMDQWFRFVLFGRQPDMRTEAGPHIFRALSEGTDSEGGYVVPPGFIAEIIGDANALTGLYQYGRRVPVNTMSGEIPVVATNAGVSWGSENTAMGESDPAFANATFAIKRLNALVKLSREVANDANPSIVDYVVEMFRQQIIEERDRVVAVGNGTTEPQGLRGAAGMLDLTSTVTAISYANLVTLHETVDHRYIGRPDFRWAFNQTHKSEIMKLVDTQGRPLIQLDPTAGFAPRLFNTPISIDNNIPNDTLFIGALRFYMIFDRETLGTERSTEAGTAFATHQLWVKFWERWDGKPVFPPTKPMARTTGIVIS
jgi:HK97 family phage major capsid protein